MTQLSLVLLQFDIAYGDPGKNRQHIRQLFAQANLKPNELVLLPELWDTAYDLSSLAKISDPEGKNAKEFLSSLAIKYQVFIFGGSIARLSNNKVFNTSYVLNPEGQVITTYDKAHLFCLMEEDKYLHAGDHLAQFQLADFTAAPFICYDLRFPEWLRKSAAQKSDLFLICAQWPSQRILHWEKLLQARAIENQAFVAAVNRVGQDPDNQFGGHSMVIDPKGEVLLRLADQETTSRCMINQQEVQKIRSQLPIFSDRRTNLY
ncbi:MAG TPA: carbon-nitrogen family hydrolase [Tetragenococcus sp.]|nr:carbon-nitrogen family hydrolase [Tetragenococcus sp.]